MLLALLLALAPTAFAEGGVPVRIEVTDGAGAPVPTAVVQSPVEDVRHEVNKTDGSWEGTKIYTKDGAEVVFAPGLELSLAVSAPGYRTSEVQYVVRKKKNVLIVALQTLPATSGEPRVDPTVGFDHDDPIDGATP